MTLPVADAWPPPPPPPRRDATLIALAIAQLHGLTQTIQALREYRRERAAVDAAVKALGGKEH